MQFNHKRIAKRNMDKQAVFMPFMHLEAFADDDFLLWFVMQIQTIPVQTLIPCWDELNLPHPLGVISLRFTNWRSYNCEWPRYINDDMHLVCLLALPDGRLVLWNHTTDEPEPLSEYNKNPNLPQPEETSVGLCRVANSIETLKQAIPEPWDFLIRKPPKPPSIFLISFWAGVPAEDEFTRIVKFGDLEAVTPLMKLV